MYESYLNHCKKHWEKKTTIERINVNWNYCKDNCTWATPTQQARNRTNSLNYKGKNLMEYCEELKINENTLRTNIRNYRIKHNVSAKKAFINIMIEKYNIT